jgi:hypothetical protein
MVFLELLDPLDRLAVYFGGSWVILEFVWASVFINGDFHRGSAIGSPTTENLMEFITEDLHGGMPLGVPWGEAHCGIPWGSP